MASRPVATDAARTTSTPLSTTNRSSGGEGAQLLAACAGRLTPSAALSAFDNENSSGQWRLTVADQTATGVENACNANAPAISGSFIPNDPASVFDGEAAGGTWRLNVSDHAADDVGELNAWCLFLNQ